MFFFTKFLKCQYITNVGFFLGQQREYHKNFKENSSAQENMGRYQYMAVLIKLILRYRYQIKPFAKTFKNWKIKLLEETIMISMKIIH